MNTKVTKRPPHTHLSPPRDDSLYMQVLAVCKITVGDRCRIHFPIHYDAESYAYHRAYHNQEAAVHAVNSEKSVDLHVLTGPRKDEIVTGVDSGNLLFFGPYAKEE